MVHVASFARTVWFARVGLIIVFCFTGCATKPAPGPSRAPGHYWSAGATTGGAGYAMHSGPWMPKQRSPAFHARPDRMRPGARSLQIVSGSTCLSWLQGYGIAYEPLGARRGIDTPVRVLGPIAGVDYYRVDHEKLVCDCRLAVALYWISNELRALGVTRVRHSGAYAYRNTRSGRLSLHARGLAIDIHEIELENVVLSIEDDFRAGLPEHGCRATPLNWLACRLERLDLFRELLTPDDNRDHRDHLHLAIAPS